VTCTSPIEFEALIAYWLGELPATEEAPLEEHLFACASCTARLEALASLAAGIRATVREGQVAAVISVPFLEALKHQGLRIREYRVPAGGRVDCTLRADEDAVVSRMQAPLAGVTRVDALRRLELGGEVLESRLEDVPFDPAAGEVLHLPSAAWVRGLPANTLRVRLVAVEAAGEREIGEYTFAHTPS
jgi:anti-sigma factor RsiW